MCQHRYPGSSHYLLTVGKYPDLLEMHINGLGDDGINRSFALK